MNKLSLLFMIAMLLSSCGSKATAQTTTTAEATLTLTPSLTPRPTATITPTITPTPSLPESIELTFDKSISEKIQNEIRVIVDQAYWFYVELGCSPDGFNINFYLGFGGYTDYVNDGVKTDTGVLESRTEFSPHEHVSLSHEMAHAMCQLAFTRRANMGSIDLRWLTEAVANIYSTQERIAHGNGSYFFTNNFSNWERDRLHDATQGFCGFSPALLEKGDADKVHPNEYWVVGEAATIFLVNSSPDGLKAIWDYYKLLNKESAAKAFQEAFGRTKEDFYTEYQTECRQGFPTILASGKTTPIGTGCVSESNSNQGLSIKCFGRMAKEFLPLRLQDRNVVYGFEVSGLDLTTLGTDINKIISRPKGFLVDFDSNILYVIIPASAAGGDYFVTITLSDGRFATAIYHWER